MKKTGQKKKDGGSQQGNGGQESCRCKEVAKKTPIEMIKLMLSDFAFWKKKDKGNGESSVK